MKNKEQNKKKLIIAVILFAVIALAITLGIINANSKERGDESVKTADAGNDTGITTASVTDTETVATPDTAEIEVKVYEETSETIVNEDGTKTEIEVDKEGVVTVKDEKGNVTEIVTKEDGSVEVTDASTGKTKTYESIEEAEKAEAVITGKVTQTVNKKEDTAAIVTITVTITPTPVVTSAGNATGTPVATNTPSQAKPTSGASTSTPTATVMPVATQTPTQAVSTPTKAPTSTPTKVPTNTPTQAPSKPYVTQEIWEWWDGSVEKTGYETKTIDLTVVVHTCSISKSLFVPDIHDSYLWVCNDTNWADFIFEHSYSYKFDSPDAVKAAINNGSLVITRPWLSGDEYWEYIAERYRSVGWDYTASDAKNEIGTTYSVLSAFIDYAGEMGYSYGTYRPVIGTLTYTKSYTYWEDKQYYVHTGDLYSDGSIVYYEVRQNDDGSYTSYPPK